MSRNSENMFSGYDMQGYRFRLSDCEHGPSRAEAKALGFTLKVNGRLRRYYDAEGTLLFAYSYDACIYTRVFDQAEGFYRDIFNSSKYSVTTAKHQRDIMWETLGIVPWQFEEGYGPTHYAVWPDTESTREPFSLRARRAMQMVNVNAYCSHIQFATWASEFVNRADNAVALYLSGGY